MWLLLGNKTILDTHAVLLFLLNIFGVVASRETVMFLCNFWPCHYMQMAFVPKLATVLVFLFVCLFFFFCTLYVISS